MPESVKVFPLGVCLFSRMIIKCTEAFSWSLLKYCRLLSSALGLIMAKSHTVCYVICQINSECVDAGYNNLYVKPYSTIHDS